MLLYVITNIHFLHHSLRLPETAWRHPGESYPPFGKPLVYNITAINPVFMMVIVFKTILEAVLCGAVI